MHNCLHILPVMNIEHNVCIFADYGVEHAVTVNGLDRQAIESKLQELVKTGESLPRYE